MQDNTTPAPNETPTPTSPEVSPASEATAPTPEVTLPNPETSVVDPVETTATPVAAAPAPEAATTSSSDAAPAMAAAPVSSDAATATPVAAPTAAPAAAAVAGEHPKNHIVALLLSIFLGYLGIDRFYLGHIGLGIAKLLLCWLTFGIWWLIDVILIATRKVKNVTWES